MTSFLDIFIATFLGGLGMTLGCFLGLGIVKLVVDKLESFTFWI